LGLRFQPIREWVGNADPNDYFSFSLGQRSRLFTGIRGKQKGVQLQLLQDENGNGRIDTGELIGQRSSQGNRLRRLNTNLAPGTYFLSVSKGAGNSSYRLTARIRPQETTPSPNSELDGLRQEILQLINQKRQQHGLAPVNLENRLSSAAQTHSANMALQDFYSHTGQDGSRFSDRVSRTGYNWSRVTENIAAGFKTAASVVDGWMNSPGHRANILDGQVTQMGVGYEYLSTDTGNVNYRHYWTQVFARPR